ncbi:SymE family type I addiction module toxin [Riemerella anatipestifer]|uniref:SymE family type I addiction module toxin n=1 Tax=Riemerella anatipestifer TaxID=34085 RepID=UPI00208E2464|nr:SymE family type I addiction module toxin [Riemerella anatipestifer]MCO4303226.1 type I toxin-antitoxin system SymE family toxin [Riemerella anatipestifer]MCO7353638.1 type I toxin-antitoxin system SymE family toxin [Riemerella anatipestifer]MCQ4039000.1 type I toxin-antitoxin system SymE family toxin [Riemerella anatipestifer]MCT6759938.1 type I toxin-antitoxin system SymE family toxin [Riemerella anatipestifer]MCT6764197.1 type I toxin-antitoxin system SymE family toxin [Riemerella anatip
MNFRELKISYLFQNNKKRPKILLSGKWLNTAGFEIGESVKVEVFKNKIIIRNEN